MVLRECKKVDGGLPGRISFMMLLNIIIDLAIGFVPLVGDLADAIYKCNTRNAILLEKHLRDKAANTLDRLDRRDAPGPSRPPAARPARDNSNVSPWFGGSKQKQRDLERDA
jgi:hypothetical protein